MKLLITIFLLSLCCSPMAFSNNATSKVITCFDVTNDNISRAARSSLHKQAQQRAQRSIELFMEKPILTPYFDGLGQPAKAENMATLIEVFWCDNQEKPLHSAYYDFYSRNKNAFK
ncbi:hypothetical protein A9Q75_17320 [Colwellia psychrerythraea]|uniref:Lipoprotein n=1 Tax=Colwellia psychrerythraea TaxID=28229 RepID=A0A1Y5E395_COLPS|nr:hypothetical protein A9Q75_17320 [Colwellia psychrerythraea]